VKITVFYQKRMMRRKSSHTMQQHPGFLLRIEVAGEWFKVARE